MEWLGVKFASIADHVHLGEGLVGVVQPAASRRMLRGRFGSSSVGHSGIQKDRVVAPGL